VPATTMSQSPSSRANKIPVRKITNADANAALREGWADFMEMRGDLIFVGLLYPLIGVVAATAVLGGPLLPLLFPIVAGIGLLGPAAIGDRAGKPLLESTKIARSGTPPRRFRCSRSARRWSNLGRAGA